jgi:hypothetical protein
MTQPHIASYEPERDAPRIAGDQFAKATKLTKKVPITTDSMSEATSPDS